MKEASKQKFDSNRIITGIRKAVQKLVEETAARNGSLVIERNGKIVHVPAKEILLELQNKK